MVNIGQIGAGSWGQNLLRNFFNLKECSVKVCCDKNQEVLEKVKSTYNNKIKVTSSFDDLLKKHDLDAVVVATLPATHASFTIKALSCGKHVFVEKPLALKIEDAKEMVKAAKKNKKRPLCQGKHRRDAAHHRAAPPLRRPPWCLLRLRHHRPGKPRGGRSGLGRGGRECAAGVAREAVQPRCPQAGLCGGPQPLFHAAAHARADGRRRQIHPMGQSRLRSHGPRMRRPPPAPAFRHRARTRLSPRGAAPNRRRPARMQIEVRALRNPVAGGESLARKYAGVPRHWPESPAIPSIAMISAPRSLQQPPGRVNSGP